MTIRKTMAVLSLTLVSGGAVADWQLIGSNGREFSLFADLDAARRSGSVVSVPQMVTFGEPQVARTSGRTYLSERSLIEFDCAAKRARTESTEQYAGDRGTGGIVYRDGNRASPWMPIPSRTNMEVAWQRACATS